MQVAIIHNFAFRVASFGQTVPVVYDKHGDILMVGKVGEKFGRNEEVLPTVFGARHLDELIVHRSLILDVHTLSKQ
jgi:hypothetical protein